MEEIKGKIIKFAPKLAIILVVIVVMAVGCSIFIGNKKNNEQLEDFLVEKTKKYLVDHKDKRPTDEHNQVTIKDTDLSKDNKYMKEISTYVKKDMTCSGEVIVTKNMKDYIYTPILDCGKEYKTPLLVDKILEDNKIDEKDLYTYKYKVESYSLSSKLGKEPEDGQPSKESNSDNNHATLEKSTIEKTDYVFKGEYPNNFVKYAGKLWRILRIKSDNRIRLLQTDYVESVVWDNRFNVEAGYTAGINDYSISRIREAARTSFNNNVKNQYSMIALPQELCVGGQSDKSNDWTGNKECSSTLYGDKFGMIQLNEYFMVSLDPKCEYLKDLQCNNYNYLYPYVKTQGFWTITKNNDNTMDVYMLNYRATAKEAATDTGLRLTVEIPGDLLSYTDGKGTEKDPYIVEYYYAD